MARSRMDLRPHGVFQGIVIIYETAATKFRDNIRGTFGDHIYRPLMMIRTYILFALSLLFFRVAKSAMFYTYRHIFDGMKTNIKEMRLGMGDQDWLCSASLSWWCLSSNISIPDTTSSRGAQNAKVWQRWTMYVVATLLIFLFGASAWKTSFISTLTILTIMKKNKPTRLYLKCMLLSLPFIAPRGIIHHQRPFMVICHYERLRPFDICQWEGSIGWFKYKMLRHRMHHETHSSWACRTKAFKHRRLEQIHSCTPIPVCSATWRNVRRKCQVGSTLQSKKSTGQESVDCCGKRLHTNRATRRRMPSCRPTWAEKGNHISDYIPARIFQPHVPMAFPQIYVTHHYEHCMRGIIINDDGPTRTFLHEWRYCKTKQK